MWTAQVDEAIAEPDHLVHLDAIVDRERGCLRRVEHRHRALPDLDLAGRQLEVDRPLRSSTHHPLDLHDILAADIHGAREDTLHDARVVAKVDEGEVLAVLAALRDPAAQLHGRVDVGRAQRSAQSGPHRGGSGSGSR